MNHIQAARLLRLMAARYIRNRATLRDIEEAMVLLRSVAPVAGEPGYRKVPA